MIVWWLDGDSRLIFVAMSLKSVRRCGSNALVKRLMVSAALFGCGSLTPVSPVHGQASAPRPAARSSVRSSTGAWKTHSSRDELTDSVRLSIYVDAVQPVRVSYRTVTPRLAIQCRSGELNIAFYVGGPSNDEAMQLRFDDGEVLTLSMDKSTNLEWLYVSTDEQPDIRQVLARLSDARRVRARFTPYLASPVTFSFEVGGLKPLLPRLEKAGCPIKTDSSAHSDEVTERSDTAVVAPSNNEAHAQTYFEFQVERPAIVLQGSPKPKYPSVLESSGLAGEVQAQFVVRSSGKVDMDSFKVLKSTNELFTQAVRNVLPRMQFSPAMIGGKAVNQLVQQSFQFAVPR